MTETLRIARYLARCGVASRRKAEEIVLEGRVRVNGAVATDLGRQIDPATDAVELDGEILALSETHLTLVVNKPPGVLVTRTDPRERTTIYDLLPEEFARESSRLVYAGRLDYASEGLLVMTTDGDLANAMVHPSTHLDKEYLVRTDSPIPEEALRTLRAGVDLGEHRTLPCRIETDEKDPRTYRIVLREGRNRQIRRMLESVGIGVRRLRRLRIGPLRLNKLEKGQWRKLGTTELAALRGTVERLDSLRPGNQKKT